MILLAYPILYHDLKCIFKVRKHLSKFLTRHYIIETKKKKKKKSAWLPTHHMNSTFNLDLLN